MNATITVEERLCPACGTRSARTRGQKNDFRMLSCETCATLYTDRNPKLAEGMDYDAYYGAENLTVPEFINDRLDEIVSTFERYRKHNRLLDVGCGAGTFLEAATRARWNAFGLEVSQTASEHLRNLGFEVFCGEIDEAPYPAEYFDVVIASELFEHVVDPGDLVVKIARVLRRGGLLWATTPHGRGLSAHLLGLKWSTVCPPEHLQLFSVAGMKRLLSGSGFSRLNISTHGTNPFEILRALRQRTSGSSSKSGSTDSSNFNRVDSSYELNEFLTEKPFRRFVKTTVNSMLNASRLGDSLKIRAEK